MTELLLIRHGETDFNAEEVFRGRLDVELNEMGLRQAEKLASYLADRQIEAVYSSPLKRALRTAQMVADSHRLEITVHPGLDDIEFGEWQGMPVAEVKGKYPEAFADWVSRPEKAALPGGENLADVRRRALDVVEGAVATHRGVVALVSHRVVNKVLICALLGVDDSFFWKIKQDNCGVSTFSYNNGRYVLTGHNDISFLKDLHHPPLADF